MIDWLVSCLCFILFSDRCFRSFDSIYVYVCLFLLFLFRLLSQGAFINNFRSRACLETARTYQLNQLSKWFMTTCSMELAGKISKRVSGQLTWVEFPCHLVLAHFTPWNRTNMLSNDDTKWNALVVAQLWCPCLRANPQLGWNQRQAIITVWHFQVVARL